MFARSKAWVCGRSLAGIVGSNHRLRHECLSVVSVVCCQVDVSATGRSPVQGGPTECGVSECDREASTTRRPWSTRGCCSIKKIHFSLTLVMTDNKVLFLLNVRRIRKDHFCFKISPNSPPSPVSETGHVVENDCGTSVPYYSEEILSRRHFVQVKYCIEWAGIESGPGGDMPKTNHLPPAWWQRLISTISPHGATAPSWSRPPIVEDLRSHSVRHTTFGTTALDEWSARRRDLYLFTHNTHSMPLGRFEPAIPASQRPQNHALNRAARQRFNYNVSIFTSQRTKSVSIIKTRYLIMSGEKIAVCS
jgi:hypothetical protein